MCPKKFTSTEVANRKLFIERLRSFTDNPSAGYLQNVQHAVWSSRRWPCEIVYGESGICDECPIHSTLHDVQYYGRDEDICYILFSSMALKGLEDLFRSHGGIILLQMTNFLIAAEAKIEDEES